MNSQDEILKWFGSRLRLIRKRRGISQERLALMCGFDRTFVAAVDRGTQNLTLVSMCRLAEVLEIGAHVFLLPEDEFTEILEQMPMKGIKVGRRPRNSMLDDEACYDPSMEKGKKTKTEQKKKKPIDPFEDKAFQDAVRKIMNASLDRVEDKEKEG